ncbi:MAG: J domain-containing protein [Caldilinea sp. CFX5]|nr:J domain-containing protein [Caldilinea sp. CFX5]
MEYKDYYSILGIAKGATEKEIRTAFRKLARQHHPDINPGNAEAEQKFKEINEAYTVLSDPEKRQLYDRFGAQWEQYQRAQEAGISPEEFARSQAYAGGGQRRQSRTMSPEEFEAIFGGMGGGMGGARTTTGGDADFSDFFDSLFSGGRAGAGGERGQPRPRRGSDIEATVELTLAEAFTGAERVLSYEDGQRIEVRTPRGVDTGSRVRVSGKGAPGRNGGPPGDLYLNVVVAPHPRFRREGDDLHVDVSVDLYIAVLGGEAEVPTLERPVVLNIPAGTQNGRVFRLRHLGMPHLRTPEQRGDLYATVAVRLPTQLTPAQRRLFEQLRESSS